MPTSTLSLANNFVEVLVEGGINLQTGTFKIALCSSAPAATDVSYTTDISAKEISATGGYSTGGNTITVSISGQTSGTYTWDASDPATWTDQGSATFPDFRYAALYESTGNGGNGYFIGWYDYGSTVDLGASETFDIAFDPSGILTIT